MIGEGLRGWIPLWLYDAMMYYSTNPHDQRRVNMRLIRMLKVIAASRLREVDREERDRIMANMNTCPTHGQTPNAWGCPECVREARHEIALLKRECNHWKANHGNQVLINRALRDRPDLGDRARGMQALVDELNELKGGKRIREMKREIDDLRKLLWKMDPVNVKPGPDNG